MTSLQDDNSPDIQNIYFADEPLKDKLLRKWFWLYALMFLAAPTGYIIKVIASQHLSVGDIGVLYSIISLVVLVATYNDLWLTESLQFYLPKLLLAKDYINAKSLMITTWLMQRVTGIIIGGSLYFISPYLQEHYFHSPVAGSVLRIFCIYFLVVNLYQVAQSIFLSVQDVKKGYWLETIRMRVIVGLVLASRFMNVVYLHYIAWFWVAGAVVATIVACYWARKDFGWLFRDYPYRINKTLLKKQWWYAFWILIGTNLLVLLFNIDQQMVIALLWPEAAWYWTNYSSLVTLGNFVATPIIGYLFPLLNELITKKDHHKVWLLYKYLYVGFWALSIVIWIVWYFYWPEIATLLFGKHFAYSGELFRIIAPVLWLYIFAQFQLQYLNSSGNIRTRVSILAATCILNIWATYIGIKYAWLEWAVYGAIGARLFLWICTGKILYSDIQKQLASS